MSKITLTNEELRLIQGAHGFINTMGEDRRALYDAGFRVNHAIGHTIRLMKPAIEALDEAQEKFKEEDNLLLEERDRLIAEKDGDEEAAKHHRDDYAIAKRNLDAKWKAILKSTVDVDVHQFKISMVEEVKGKAFPSQIWEFLTPLIAPEDEKK